MTIKAVESTAGAPTPPPPPPPPPTSAPSATPPVSARPRLPVPPLLADLAGWAWRLVLLVGTCWLLLRVAERLYLLVLPFAAALLLSALLSPMVRGLRRLGLGRVAATAVTILVGLLVLAGVFTWVATRAVAEYPQLVDQLSNAVERLPVRTTQVKQWQSDLVTQLQQHRGGVAQTVLSTLLTASEVLGAVVLAFFFTVLLLADGDRVWAWLVALFPSGARDTVHRAGLRGYRRVSGWVRGTFVIAVFHGAVVALTLFVLRVPLVAPLAILVFLGSFVPILGAVIFGAVAVLVTFAVKGWGAAAVLVGVLVVDNQIESHVLQPFLVGRYVRLHPIAVAVAITTGGLLAGLPGAVLAVPLTAAAYAVLSQLADSSEGGASAMGPMESQHS